MTKTTNYEPQPQVLANRVIMITGATRGIGKAVATAAAQHGATVVLHGRRRQALEQLSEELQHTGTTPYAIEADLEKLDWDGYLKLAQALADEYGRLDGLLHNASVLGQRAPIAHYDTMTWHRVMHVNVSAAFLLTRALLPLLQQSKDASVLFTSSGVGRTGRAFWGAYSVSKFATEGLMQVLADEMENTPVRVNSINPGATRTSMRAAAYPGEDPNTLPTPEALLPTYLYLLGPDSQGVNGEAFDAQG